MLRAIFHLLARLNASAEPLSDLALTQRDPLRYEDSRR